MRIGLVVAIEMDAINEYYKDVSRLEAPVGFEVFYTKKNDNEIYIIHTGMGVIAAASGVQYLITKYDVELIANFGVVGGLTNEMGMRKVCVVERVVHYKYDCSEFMPLKVGQVDGHDSRYLLCDEKLVNKALEVCPELKKVTCCSGDKFVGTTEEKMSIHEEFDGDVCDMESAGIILTCESNGVPCILLKAVSDGLSGGAEEFYTELKSASMLCLETADQVIQSY